MSECQPLVEAAAFFADFSGFFFPVCFVFSLVFVFQRFSRVSIRFSRLCRRFLGFEDEPGFRMQWLRV